MSLPVVSVVVLNWNAADYIAGCIQSILRSDYPHIEVILIDNHSDDGSIEKLKGSLEPRQLSRVRIYVNDRNYGAAHALNQGARAASGKYITFIATDTRIEPDCIAHLVRALEADPVIGAVSAALFVMDEPWRFDSAGEYLNQFGLLLQRHAGQEIDRGQFNEPAEIFSGKGTALTVRAEAFRKVNGYPEDYFMFLEETDLCWRLWLAGYRVVFVPSARIYHASGVSIKAHKHSTYLVKYYGARNYIYTLIKNLGFARASVIVPLQCLMWYCLSLFFAVKLRFKESWYISKGVTWNFIHIVQVLRQRRRAQMLRVVPDRELMPKIMRSVPLSYLMARVGMW